MEMETEIMVRARDEASAIIENLYSAIESLTVAVKDLTAAMQDSTGATDGFLGKASQIASIISGVTSAFEIGNGIFGEFNNRNSTTHEVLDKLKGAGLKLGPAFKNIMAVAGPKLTGAFQGIISVGPKLMGMFRGIITIAPMLAGSIFSVGWPVLAIVAAIVALIAIGVLLYQNWDTISAKAQEIWGALVEFFTGIWDSIWTKAEEVWNAISGFFSGMWESIKSLFQDNWEKILTIIFPVAGLAVLIAQNWGEIVAKVTEIWDTVTSTVAGWWETFKGFLATLNPWETLQQFWGELSVKARESWDSIQTTVTEWWETFKGFLATLNPWETLQQFWGELSVKARESWDAIQTTVTEWWDGFCSFLSGLNPWTFLKKAWDDVRQGINDVLMGIFGHSDVENWVSGLEGFLGDVDLGEQGKSMFSSLKDGANEELDNFGELTPDLNAGGEEQASPEQLKLRVEESCNSIVAAFTTMWEQVIELTTEYYTQLLAILFPEEEGLAALVETKWGKLVDEVKAIWQQVTKVSQEWWAAFEAWLGTLDPFAFLRNQMIALEIRLEKLFERLIEFQEALEDASQDAQVVMGGGGSSESSVSYASTSYAMETNSIGRPINITLINTMDSQPISERVIEIIGDKIQEQGKRMV